MEESGTLARIPPAISSSRSSANTKMRNADPISAFLGVDSYEQSLYRKQNRSGQTSENSDRPFHSRPPRSAVSSITGNNAGRSLFFGFPQTNHVAFGILHPCESSRG